MTFVKSEKDNISQHVLHGITTTFDSTLINKRMKHEAYVVKAGNNYEKIEYVVNN